MDTDSALAGTSALAALFLASMLVAASPTYAQNAPSSDAPKKASVADEAPAVLVFFNNGPPFGLPGIEVGDVRPRTQLSGDWSGCRTELARRGLFFDLYSTSAYQNVASGGLETGNAFVQNTQLSINVDTGRAGLWSGGVVHVTLESRYGSCSPQNTFTVGATVPQYTGLAIPGPFLVHDVLPTEYFLFQSLTPTFAVVLGKTNALQHADQTLFGNSYKYYFANLNFNKIPMALNFFNTTSLAVVGLWTPSQRLTVAGGVFDPNSEADNLATKAFDRVNVYGITIFSYTIGNLVGQSSAQANWTNKPKIDLTSPLRAVVAVGRSASGRGAVGDSFSSGVARQLQRCGLGIYHNGISQPLKAAIAGLTDAAATLKNEQGLEVFYDVAITPAIRLIPSYQHIWNPTTAMVAKSERGADVLLLRSSVAR